MQVLGNVGTQASSRATLMVSHMRLRARLATNGTAPPLASTGPNAEKKDEARTKRLIQRAIDRAHREYLRTVSHASALCNKRVLVRRGDHLWADSQGRPNAMSLPPDSCVHIVCERGVRLWGQWIMEVSSGGTLCRADCRFIGIGTILRGRGFCMCVVGGPWIFERCAVSASPFPCPPTASCPTGQAVKSHLPIAPALPDMQDPEAVRRLGEAQGFLAAACFGGVKSGWCFKKGRFGVGYYWDSLSRPSLAQSALSAFTSVAYSSVRHTSPLFRPGASDYYEALHLRVYNCTVPKEYHMHVQPQAASSATAQEHDGQESLGWACTASKGVVAMMVVGDAEVVGYRSHFSGGLYLADECEVMVEDCHLADTGVHGSELVDAISLDDSSSVIARRCIFTDNSRACVAFCGEGDITALIDMCEFVGNAGAILHADYAEEELGRIRTRASLHLSNCIIRDGASLWRGDRYVFSCVEPLLCGASLVRCATK